MAKVRASASTFFASDVLDCVVRLPEHATDDLLLLIVAKDDATGGALTTPAGWTKGGENANGASGTNTVRAAWYYKIAASSAESDPTVSSSDADSWSAVAVSIRGVNTGSPIDTSNTNGITDSTGNPYPAASVTTGFNDSLVFYGIASDGGVSPVARPGFTTVGIADSGSDACAWAYKVQRTAGASGTCDFDASGTADESVLFTVAVRDGSSGAILPGYPNADVATVVRPLKGANLTFGSDTLDANSNNFTQLAGTWTAVDTAYQVDASPLTFTDVTTAANNATDADVVPFPATEATGDYFAIGYSAAFRAVRFDRAGCTAGAAGVCAREYLSTSGTWKALPEFFDSTTSFTTAVGDHHVCGWSLPQDWTSQSLNGVSKFWIRFRITTIYTTNPTISQVFISTALALFHDTLTGLGDTGTNPLFDSTYVTPGFGGNLMSGGAYSMVSVVNLSSALLIGTYIFATPRDFVDLGFRADGGVALGLLDSTNKVKAWTVGAADAKDTYADKRNIFAVQVAQSVDTALLTNAPTMSDIKRLLLMANNRYGACNVAFNQLLNVGTLKISGGGSSAPVDYDELVRAANAYPCPLIDAITNVAYCPIQIGGNEAVNCQASGFTLTFPQQATVANKKAAFHVDTNVVGVIIDARAGDTCKLTSAKITSLSPYVFNFLATASASATYDFAGLVVENATVTLREVFTFAGISFTNCPSFTQNGAAIDGCAFTGTKVTSDDPANLSNNSFTSAGTGHAIEITTPGTYAFDANTFVGYGADGTTDAAIYNNSGGAVTLNLQNYGDQVPTVRNGAGASTTIVGKPNVASVTGIVAGSRIWVRNNTTATTIANEVVAGTTWSLDYQEGDEFSDGDSITVRLTRQNGATAYLGFSVGASAGAIGWSVLAAQVADTMYAALAVDGSTVTGIEADYTNDQVDITVAADFYLRDLYAWWVYNLTTSQGISDFFGGMTAVDEGNFLINTGTVSIYLDNDTATNVYALDNRRLYRSDGARPVVQPTTGGGGIDVEWRSPVLLASGGGSLTAADVWAHTTRELTSGGVSAIQSGLATAASVAALPTAAAIRSEIDANSTKLDATVSSRLAAASYTAPLDASATEAAATAALVAFDPATQAALDATEAVLVVEHNATQAAIAALPAPDNAGITAIKAKTDSLTFTNAGQVDANVQAMNDAEVIGTGTTGDAWRGVGVAP
jgi:hypothetical protein